MSVALLREPAAGEAAGGRGDLGRWRLLAGPVRGKTYSLYGAGATTDGYFDAVDVHRAAPPLAANR